MRSGVGSRACATSGAIDSRNPSYAIAAFAMNFCHSAMKVATAMPIPATEKKEEYPMLAMLMFIRNDESAEISAEIARRWTSIIANMPDCEPLTMMYLMFFECFAYGRAMIVTEEGPLPVGSVLWRCWNSTWADHVLTMALQ